MTTLRPSYCVSGFLEEGLQAAYFGSGADEERALLVRALRHNVKHALLGALAPHRQAARLLRKHRHGRDFVQQPRLAQGRLCVRGICDQ